jgi:hypothetical protein
MNLFIYVAFTFLTVLACNSNDLTEDKEVELKKITNLEEEIVALAASSVCNDKTECDAIAFGSKPCGGPWSYLVYSNSIDIDLLKSKVEEFNKMQKEYNTKHGIISDCAVVMPPRDIICEDNKCKAVDNSVPIE